MVGMRLLVATSNPGKYREIKEGLAPLGWTLFSLLDYPFKMPPEEGSTFEDNAVLKAAFAAKHSGLPTLADALALPTRHFRQDIAHAKLRLAGDLVYGPWPQLSLGLQHKRQRDFLVPSLVGAVDDSGNDVYLAATKLFLGGAGGRHLLVNGVLRSSNANQTGLLGFGGDARRGRSLLGEASVAVLLDPRWAVGVEYRQKPDNLGFAREHDWKDVFVGWFPNKRVAVVAAYADFGSIATLDRQEAWYVSVQLSH